MKKRVFNENFYFLPLKMTLRDEELLRIFKEVIEEVPKRCPTCSSDTVGYNTNPLLMRCKWGACGKRFSLGKDTPFYKAQESTTGILKILRMWCAKVELSSISELLEVSRQCVSRVIKNMKAKLIKSYYANIPKIGGPGVIVEIDESKFGKVKYHRGHRVEGVWVFGMVERIPLRRIIFVPVENRKKSTLEELLVNYVHPDSIIYSDCWRSYNELSELFLAHYTVNHSENFVDPLNNTHTNTIEGNWAGVKQQTSIPYRVKGLVELHLIRYVLKRNYEKGSAFKMFLKYLLLS